MNFSSGCLYSVCPYCSKVCAACCSPLSHIAVRTSPGPGHLSPHLSGNLLTGQYPCHIQRQPRKELRLGSTIWPDRHSHIGCTLSQSKTRVSHGYHTCTLSYSDDLGSEPVQCLLAYVSRNSMTGKAGLADCIHVVCCGVSVPIMMTPIP